MASNADKIPAFSLPSIPATPAPSARIQRETGPKEATPPAPVAAPPASADYRLVIDEDPTSGTFIYKTVDRVTGEVITQLPREELLRLRDHPAYSAGSVVNAKA